jgi:hypothetical protein
VFVTIVTVLAGEDVPPFCRAPNGPPGEERRNGVQYRFETVRIPIGPRATGVDGFRGAAFSVTVVETNASYGVIVNLRTEDRPEGSVRLGAGLRASPPPWLTALTSGEQYGTRSPGADLEGLRLLGRA